MAALPLVLFTLLLQAAAGAAWVLGGLAWWLAGHGQAPAARALAARGWPGLAGLALLGVLASAAHLGVLANAWRAACNWRTSWLSREILAAAGFTGAALAAAAAPRLPGLPGLGPVARGLALLAGLALVHCMAKVYRLGPVPAWNTPATPAGFFTSALLLGGLAVGGLPGFDRAPLAPARTGLALAALLLACLSLALGGLWLARLPAAMRARILARHRPLLLGRCVLALAGMGAAGLTLLPGGPEFRLPLRLAALAALAGAEALGRTLFYAGQLAHGVYGYRG